MKTALVAIAGGDAYLKYAEALMESAATYFRPTEEVEFHIIPGESSWPNGTMMRWHRLLENLPRAHFVYLCDADMLMVSAVGPAILPPGGFGITATQHPGYVSTSPPHLPFERRLQSASYVGLNDGSVYHCGGFVGGERMAVRMLGARITRLIDKDIVNDVVPTWHDESALNRVLASDPPDRLLSPSYCYPGANLAYYKNFWPRAYVPQIVAVEKTQAERGDR